jgi:hypothetical protein
MSLRVNLSGGWAAIDIGKQTNMATMAIATKTGLNFITIVPFNSCATQYDTFFSAGLVDATPRRHLHLSIYFPPLIGAIRKCPNPNPKKSSSPTVAGWTPA